MPRSLRLEYPGAFYHVKARGFERENIFHHLVDRDFFLETLGAACGMTGWRAHAWVLMNDHYHLLLETPEANLVAGMKWLQSAYTRRLNTRHGLSGRVFGDRYKAVPVEGADAHYYRTLVDYIHLNPVRGRLIKPKTGQSVLAYPWSSVAAGYALPPKQRPKWLAAESGLRIFGLPDTAAGRRDFVKSLDQRAAEEQDRAGLPPAAEIDGRISNLRRGWYFGNPAFAKELLAKSRRAPAKRRARSRAGTDPGQKAHDLARAETMLQEGLHAAGLTKVEARRLSGSEARKVAIAQAIWRTTTVSQIWLSDQLGMRSAANVSQQLRREDLGEIKGKLPPALRQWLNTVKA